MSGDSRKIALITGITGQVIMSILYNIHGKKFANTFGTKFCDMFFRMVPILLSSY